MKQFANLFATLDGTTKTNLKVQALADFFRQAPAADSAWAIYFLSGRRLRQPIPNQTAAPVGCRSCSDSRLAV
jgi:DNA ligase 1